MREIKQLTKAEFQVMQILWNLPGQGGFTGDILAEYEDPKPAYTTLATFLKILTSKGFIRCRKKGNKLYYTPTVSQKDYAEVYFAPVKSTFFHDSFQEMIRFLFDREHLSEGEVRDIIDIIHESQKR